MGGAASFLCQVPPRAHHLWGHQRRQPPSLPAQVWQQEEDWFARDENPHQSRAPEYCLWQFNTSVKACTSLLPDMSTTLGVQYNDSSSFQTDNWLQQVFTMQNHPGMLHQSACQVDGHPGDEALPMACLLRYTSRITVALTNSLNSSVYPASMTQNEVNPVQISLSEKEIGYASGKLAQSIPSSQLKFPIPPPPHTHTHTDSAAPISLIIKKNIQSLTLTVQPTWRERIYEAKMGNMIKNVLLNSLPKPGTTGGKVVRKRR